MRAILIKLPILLGLLVLFFSVPDSQVSQTIYDVSGVVYSPDSKPLANVLVTLENHARAHIGQDVTNSDGRYQFNGLVAGVYYLVVKPDENQFHRVIQQIELINTSVGGNSISTERVDFTLKPNLVRNNSFSMGTVFAQTVPPEAEKEYVKGIKSLQKNETDAAAAAFEKAVTAFPTYFLALQRLGLVYVDQKKYREAIVPLRKAVEVNSKAAESHYGLGVAYLNLDELKTAIEELNIARTLEPGMFRVHLYLGMALMDAGDLAAAEQSLKQAYKLGGPVEGRTAHLYLASIYDQRKEYRKAIDELETYLRDNPKAANAARIQEAIQKLKAKL